MLAIVITTALTKVNYVREWVYPPWWSVSLRGAGDLAREHCFWDNWRFEQDVLPTMKRLKIHEQDHDQWLRIAIDNIGRVNRNRLNKEEWDGVLIEGTHFTIDEDNEYVTPLYNPVEKDEDLHIQ